jgi:hypothetical protein
MKLKKLMHCKRNSHQTENPDDRMGENLCQLYIWQGINNQNIQEAQKTKLPKSQGPNDLNRVFFKGRSPNGQKKKN